MTATLSTKEYKKKIVGTLDEVLKPAGFKKNGNIYSLVYSDITHFISLQSSMSSSASVLKITINIEMCSLQLAAFRDDRIPLSAYRNYNRRIGTFIDEKPDKWWMISNMQQADDASHEIRSIVSEQVLPYLTSIQATDDLIKIWQSGRCDGVSVQARQHYLKLLGADLPQ